MDAERIKATLQAKLGVEMDFKLEWDAFRFLLFGKMFAMLGYNKQQEKILTLKLPPQEGAWYRDEYAFITEGYYMNKVHWISVRYELASKELMEELMEKSYANFLQRLTRKQQQQLASEDSIARHPDISFLFPILYTAQGLRIPNPVYPTYCDNFLGICRSAAFHFLYALVEHTYSA